MRNELFRSGPDPILTVELENGTTMHLRQPDVRLYLQLQDREHVPTAQTVAAVLSCNGDGTVYTAADAALMLDPADMLGLLGAYLAFTVRLQQQTHLQVPQVPQQGGEKSHYMASTIWLHEVAQYANMTVSDVLELDLDDYLLLRRDAFIVSMMATPKGREYLEDAWRLQQTKPDRAALRAKFGGG